MLVGERFVMRCLEVEWRNDKLLINTDQPAKQPKSTYFELVVTSPGQTIPLSTGIQMSPEAEDADFVNVYS